MSAGSVRVRRVLAGVAIAICLPQAAAAQASAPPSASPPMQAVTLDQAVQLALANNQTLRAARLGIRESQADEITAGLKPNPTVSLLSEDLPVFSPSNFNSDYLANSSVITPSLSYLFERGGKREKRVAVARDTTTMTSQTVLDTERQIRFQVAQAFVGALLAKSNLQFAQDDLKGFSQEVTLNQQRMQSGDISEGDYLKIALQQLQFQQDVVAAQIALVQSKASLRQLLGYTSVTDDFDVIGTLEHQKSTVTLQSLDQDALASRPDYLAAQTGLRLAQDTESLAYANRARDLTGEVEWQHNGPINGVGFGLSMDLPIHDRNQGNIAHSTIAINQASETAAAARVAALTDVMNAYEGLKTNDQLASLYESGYLKQAQDSLDISRYAYERGATALLDLLDAERTFRDTQLAYRQALAAYMISVAQVNFAVGKQVIP